MSNEPVGYLEEIHDRAYRSGFIAGRDSERTDTPNVELKKDYQQFGTAIYTHPSQEWITARNNYDANDIPLYTHPAKTLTDQEILDASTLGDPNVAILYLSPGVKEKVIQRGRAVLRKACGK